MHLQIYQVGVISYGLGCANPRWPALYTRVTKVCQHFNYGIINKKYFFNYINDGFPRAALRLKKRENFRNLGLILPFLPFCGNLTKKEMENFSYGKFLLFSHLQWRASLK